MNFRRGTSAGGQREAVVPPPGYVRPEAVQREPGPQEDGEEDDGDELPPPEGPGWEEPPEEAPEDDEDQLSPTFVTLRNLVPQGPPTLKVYKKLGDRKSHFALRLWYVVRPIARGSGPWPNPIGPGVDPGVYNIIAFRRVVNGKELPVLNAMRREIRRGAVPPIVLYSTVDSALNHLAAEFENADRAGAPLKESTSPLRVYVE
jgi:hypothetical protein